MSHKKTMEVVAELASEGCTYWRLISALRGGKIVPLPGRDSSGDMIWSPESIASLGVALKTDLRRKRNKPTVAEAAAK